MEKYEFKKKKGNYKFLLILFLIAGGYAFFFTSTSWMPSGAAATLLTPLGQEQTWEERTFQIIRWEYSESQQLMEIEMDIRNQSFDGVNIYQYSAVDRAGDNLSVTTVIEEPDWAVLQIQGISSSFGEISIRVAIPGKDELSPLRLYTNVNDVKKVERLTKKDRTGYRRGRFEQQIETYRKEIQKKEKRIQTLTFQNEQMQLEISRLQGDISYQTEEQKEETESRVNEIAENQTSNQEEMEKLQAQIEELQERIQLIEKQIAEWEQK